MDHDAALERIGHLGQGPILQGGFFALVVTSGLALIRLFGDNLGLFNDPAVFGGNVLYWRNIQVGLIFF
ncbi:hypothetical protein D3C86_2109910 [compost metagenome]